MTAVACCGVGLARRFGCVPLNDERWDKRRSYAGTCSTGMDAGDLSYGNSEPPSALEPRELHWAGGPAAGRGNEWVLFQRGRKLAPKREAWGYAHGLTGIAVVGDLCATNVLRAASVRTGGAPRSCEVMQATKLVLIAMGWARDSAIENP